MATLAELIEKYRITIEVQAGAPPKDDPWDPIGYTVTLRRDASISLRPPSIVTAKEDGGGMAPDV